MPYDPNFRNVLGGRQHIHYRTDEFIRPDDGIVRVGFALCGRRSRTAKGYVLITGDENKVSCKTCKERLEQIRRA